MILQPDLKMSFHLLHVFPVQPAESSTLTSGASSHMTGVHNYFSSLKEEEMDLYIEMGNNSKCRATGHGTVTFQRESRKSPMVKDVLYVLGMTKNLIFISTLEDRGNVVSFQDGRVYISRRTPRQPK
jgi:hypothetical protein